MKRREWLRHALVTGAVLGPSRWPAFGASVDWPIGCFNRPWTKWSFDDALLQIRAAGYHTMGLLTRTKDEPFIAADASPEYLARHVWARIRVFPASAPMTWRGTYGNGA